MNYSIYKILILTLISTTIGYGQSELNNYKYFIVENQYGFQESANEFRLNEQIVFELQKRKFEAYRNIEVLPKDLNQGTCNAAQIKISISKGLETKVSLEFVDCDNNLIYGPIVGTSRLKNYEKDYRAALRKAIASLDDYYHEYNNSINNSIKTMSNTEFPDKTISTNIGIPGNNSNKVYHTKDDIYTLKQENSDFTILKKGTAIGTLKKSSSGCYLAVTTDFIGIGYKEEDVIKIEFDKQGTQILIFKK